MMNSIHTTRNDSMNRFSLDKWSRAPPKLKQHILKVICSSCRSIPAPTSENSVLDDLKGPIHWPLMTLPPCPPKA